MKDINEIKETIKKLQKITFENNASEGEVENAARIVQNLLIKYHLELNDIPEDEVKDKEAIQKDLFETGRLLWYIEMLISILKKYYFVSVYIRKMNGKSCVFAVGFPEDIEVFEKIFNFCKNSMINNYKKLKKKNPDLVRNDYYNGFISGLDTVLEENKNVNIENNEEGYSTSLVVVNNAIEKVVKNFNTKKRSKSGIQPKFQNNVKSYSEGFIDGKFTGKNIGKHNILE